MFPRRTPTGIGARGVVVGMAARRVVLLSWGHRRRRSIDGVLRWLGFAGICGDGSAGIRGDGDGPVPTGRRHVVIFRGAVQRMTVTVRGTRLLIPAAPAHERDGETAENAHEGTIFLYDMYVGVWYHLQYSNNSSNSSSSSRQIAVEYWGREGVRRGRGGG